MRQRVASSGKDMCRRSSTVEHRFCKPLPPSRKPPDSKDLDAAPSDLSAPVQRAAEKAENMPETPPDLACVAAAWQQLPEAVKAGILAMVTASRKR